MAKEMRLNAHAFGLASGVITLLFGILDLMWHELFGQPTMIGFVYPGFNWTFTSLVAVWVAAVILAYFAGYVFAWLYNKLLKP